MYVNKSNKCSAHGRGHHDYNARQKQRKRQRHEETNQFLVHASKMVKYVTSMWKMVSEMHKRIIPSMVANHSKKLDALEYSNNNKERIRETK
jgi:hypothetical protein